MRTYAESPPENFIARRSKGLSLACVAALKNTRACRTAAAAFGLLLCFFSASACASPARSVPFTHTAPTLHHFSPFGSGRPLPPNDLRIPLPAVVQSSVSLSLPHPRRHQ